MKMDSRAFRDALGRFATGIALITTHSPDGAPVGLTVNAFASVSLDPPLLLWCLGKSSDRFACFAKTDAFAVNILSSEQKDLAAHFGKQGTSALDAALLQDASSAPPFIKGALVSIECGTHKRYEAGDHLIIIGRARALSENKEAAEALLFYEGAYHTLNTTGKT